MLLNKQRLNSRNRCQAASIIIEDLNLQKKFHTVTNIKYALYYCNVHDDGISTVVEIPPRKSPMSYIARHNSSDDDADYAVRFSYELDNQKYPVGGNKKLLFIFIADHSFSNTTVCIKKEYYDSDIIDGIYQIGDSTKIISNHPES